MKRVLALVIIAVLVAGLFGCGQDSKGNDSAEKFDTLVVGYGKEDVTPYTPVYLGGYNDDLQRLSTGVKDAFYATTVAMTDPDGTTLLLIMTDLHYGYVEILNALKPMVEEEFGISGDNIMLGATHNHSGPSIHRAYNTPENQAYYQFFYEGVLRSIETALNDRMPATFQVGRTETENVGFCRRYYMDDGTFFGGGTDPKSGNPVRHETDGDEEVQLVKILREGGKDILISQWQNHACHAGNTAVASTDWVGPMRRKVEQEVDAHFMYIQGAGADMATSSLITEEYPVKKTCEEVGYAVADTIVSGYKDDSLFRPVKTGKINIKKVQYTDRNPGTRSFSVELNAISVGDLAVATAPFEMFSGTGLDIKEKSPFEMTLIMGFTNSIGNYVGTREAFQNGGYGVSNGGVGCAETADEIVEIYIDSFNQMKQ